MKYVYAMLILNETGSEINEPNITAVLKAAGADTDASRVKAYVAAVEGVNLDATIINDDSVTASENPPESESADQPDKEEKKVNETEEDEGTEPSTGEPDSDEVVDGSQGEGA